MNNDNLCLKDSSSPTQSLHANQILAIQKVIGGHESNKTDAINDKCDKVGLVQTNNGTNVLKNGDYDWWIKKDNPQVKRLHTAYLQDIKIHRCDDFIVMKVFNVSK